MQSISAARLYPIILTADALQAWRLPMNGALRDAVTNPWLATTPMFAGVALIAMV